MDPSQRSRPCKAPCPRCSRSLSTALLKWTSCARRGYAKVGKRPNIRSAIVVNKPSATDAQNFDWGVGVLKGASIIQMFLDEYAQHPQL